MFLALWLLVGCKTFSECLEKTPYGVSTEAMQRQEGIGGKAGPRITPDPRRVQEGDHKLITSNSLLPFSSLHDHFTSHVEEIQWECKTTKYSNIRTSMFPLMVTPHSGVATTLSGKVLKSQFPWGLVSVIFLHISTAHSVSLQCCLPWYENGSFSNGPLENTTGILLANFSISFPFSCGGQVSSPLWTHRCFACWGKPGCQQLCRNKNNQGP